MGQRGRREIMASEEFKHESLQDRVSIARYLQALQEGLEKGHLELVSDEKTVVLDPDGLVELEVRAKRKGNRRKLSIKLSWRDDDPKTDNGGDTLEIKAD